METIMDLQHYSAITKDFKRRCSATLSNCFYMADDIKSLTAEGRLYFELIDRTLILFQDEGSYWQASFISAADPRPTLPQLDKTCVTSITQRGTELTDKNLALTKIIEGAGFSFAHRYCLYEFALEGNEKLLNETLPDLIKESERKGLKVIAFNDRYTEAVTRSWDMYLDPGTVSRRDREEGIKKSVIAVDTDNNERLCGVYMPKIEGKDFSVWHLSTDAGYRGRKLAQLLTLSLFEQAVNAGFEKVSNWIADDNIASIKLHEKMGMKATQKFSLRYILR